MSLRTRLAVGGLVFAALTLQAAPATAQSSQWRTDFGTVILTLRDGGQITGRYPDYDGRIEALLDPATSSVEGVWLQPHSEVQCRREVGGTVFWGQVLWMLRSDGTMVGQWGYCDDPVGSGGVWNGQLERGENPVTLANGSAGGNGEAGTETGGGGDPALAAEAAELARFLWGQYVNPDRMTMLRADLTCDGRPDLIVGYLDIDNPDGPFFTVAVRQPGENLEAVATTYMDFDAGTDTSLCGDAHMADLSVHDLEPESVLDLTGFTAPPLCHQSLRVDDGMCDAVWLFTMRRKDGLTELVLGRN